MTPPLFGSMATTEPAGRSWSGGSRLSAALQLGRAGWASAVSAEAWASMSRVSTRLSPATGWRLAQDPHRVVWPRRPRSSRCPACPAARPRRPLPPRSCRSRCRVGTAWPPCWVGRDAALLGLDLDVGDAPDVAEHVGGQRPVRVRAHRLALDRHRRVLVGPLREVEVDVVGDVDGDRDGLELVVRACRPGGA